MIPGEAHRERVLAPEEESGYLRAASEIGNRIESAYTGALAGIRATMRGQEPIKPQDPFRLRDAVTILIDCGLRPEECFRLRWEDVRDGAIFVLFG